MPNKKKAVGVILLVSHAVDEHATAVLAELGRLGADARILDLSQFPQQLRLVMGYERKGVRSFSLYSQSAPEIRCADIRSVWWRRPQSFKLHPEVTRGTHQTFAYNEASEAFAGFWNALDARWINHPSRDDVASRKAFQLRIAQEVGLDIPKTLITNDPEEAHRFIEEVGAGHTICKAFSATIHEWRETRLVGPAELQALDAVRYAPVIFQEYVPAIADLRITAVGEELFPAAIYSQETSYPVDFRMEMSRAHTESITLPDEVTKRLKMLLSRFGLMYGAIDMRLTPENKYVFLEINPAGQWLFVEQRTGQPITAALARLLAHGVSNQ